MNKLIEYKKINNRAFALISTSKGKFWRTRSSEFNGTLDVDYDNFSSMDDFIKSVDELSYEYNK